MSAPTQPTEFERDFLMACRYAYYCCACSIVDDHEYDVREKDYEMVNGELPVGSDDKESYTPAQRALALYFLLSGRAVDASML